MSLVENMRVVLASALSLYLNTHTAHWNVEGPNFYEIHKMLDDQYNDIWESLDDIAEHLRALDAYTPQGINRFAALSQVPPSPNAPLDPRDILIELMQGNEIVIDLMNTAIASAEEENQQGIINFLAGRIEVHQKHRWMLRASAKNK